MVLIAFVLGRKWQEKAEHELDEIPEKTKARIIQLRHMLAVTDTLPHGRRDDAFLLRFLRAKKFDVEKAYRMVFKLHRRQFLKPPE